MGRRYVSTTYKCLRDPRRFADVETLCLFIGHVKSGGTLVGSLLDAHPDALVSDEADLLRYVQAGFRRDQIFHIVEKGSRREATTGRITARRLEPYSLAVPGLSQGRSEQVRLIGDVRAGPTTRRLGGSVELLDRLERLAAPAETRLIHVVRNPFDPISAMIRRGKRSMANASQDYAAQCERLVSLRCALGRDRFLTVRYELFTGAPERELARVCAFLGLPADGNYLKRCAAIVESDRPGEREMVDWDDEAIERVERLIDAVPFLDGYEWG